MDMIDGGLASNIVPEACEIVIDMRCPDEEKLEHLKNETVSLFRNTVEMGGGSLEVEVKDVAPGVNLSTEHATVKIAISAAERLNFPVTTGFTGGCSDANFLCGMGLPTVLLATGMDKIHTTEECLALEDLNIICHYRRSRKIQLSNCRRVEAQGFPSRNGFAQSCPPMLLKQVRIQQNML